MGKRIRRTVLSAAVPLSMALAATPAMAFEPPADPAQNFDCDGGPVSGHPGDGGQVVALSTGNTDGAWSAPFNSEMIEVCD